MKSNILNNKKLVILPIISFVVIFALSMPSAISLSDTPDITPNGYDMKYEGLDDEIKSVINDAIWLSLPSDEATGSGYFHSFFRVQASPQEHGYNTDWRPVQFDELTSATFTHSVLLADVPMVQHPDYPGENFYEFQLDINQNTKEPYLSLDEFQLWTTDDPEMHNYDLVNKSFAGANLIYELDGAGDVWILMDYRWNTGSGKRDYRVLIPDDNFIGNTKEYVAVYTLHGVEVNAVYEPQSNDGFEEWGVAVVETPGIKSGYKWNDINADGLWKPNGIDGIPGTWDDELGLNGWEIEAYAGTDTLVPPCILCLHRSG